MKISWKMRRKLKIEGFNKIILIKKVFKKYSFITTTKKAHLKTNILTVILKEK